MIIFPVQLDGFSISKIGDRVIKFRTYDKYADEVSKITNGQMGQEYIIMAVPTSDKEAVSNWTEETKEQVQERFRKHMNSLINQLAELKTIKPEIFREEFKKELKEKRIIKVSTTELDVDGYAEVIVMLKNKIYDYKK